jgi:rubrerythrin
MADTNDPIAAAHGITSIAPKEPTISPVEQLLNQFEAHEREERAFVDGYRSIVDDHPNPLIRFLLKMIISDEEKHHQVVHAMAASLRSDLTWSDEGTTLHNIGEISPEERRELLRITAEFIAAEKQGIKDTKSLAKASKGYYQGSFELLLRTIIKDSEKHLMILEFIEKTLKEN